MSMFIPDVVKDIIYHYIHELKTEDIKNELKSKIKICCRCDEEKVVYKKINNHYCLCGNFVCTKCHEEDLIYLRSNQEDNFTHCLCHLEYETWDEMTDDYDSIDEDLIWQEMYGIVSWSQIY